MAYSVMYIFYVFWDCRLVQCANLPTTQLLWYQGRIHMFIVHIIISDTLSLPDVFILMANQWFWSIDTGEYNLRRVGGQDSGKFKWMLVSAKRLVFRCEGSIHTCRPFSHSLNDWLTTLGCKATMDPLVLRWEFIKENKKARRKERKHALDQENIQEKKKVFRLKNINQFVDSTKLNISEKKRV